MQTSWVSGPAHVSPRFSVCGLNSLRVRQHMICLIHVTSAHFPPPTWPSSKPCGLVLPFSLLFPYILLAGVEKITLRSRKRSVMAFVSHFNQFPSKTLSVTPPHNPQLPSKFPVFPHIPVAVPTSPSLQSLLSARQTPLPRPLFRVRVATDDEWGPEKGGSVGEGYGVAVAAEEKLPELIEIDKLKKALVDSFYGTDRGLKATSETRAEIVELITQLESKNPNPAPTEALTLLNGKWILAYTSFSGLFPLLARGGGLPLVKVEEISQTIDSANFTVQNSVQFAGPLTTTSFSTNAKFEVRSPKRVQIKFQEGIIGTPQLTDSIVIPENVEFLGQKFDLTPVKGILTSVQDTASSVVKTISKQPPLKFSIPNRNAESWLLTTYLDEDLRISRGDGGSVFVLIKEGSTLLTP